MTIKTDPRQELDDSRALVAAVAAARSAGEELLSRHRKLDRGAIRTKSSRRDLVSEADLASQGLLLAALSRAFPEDRFRAEESDPSEQGDTAAVWHLDPLDGTTNFVHGLAEFSISIARTVGGRPRVAVVFAPALGELFAARAGGGATLNGSPIEVSGTQDLADALVATGFPYRREGGVCPNAANFAALLPLVRDLRRLGSAALDLAYVAAGRFDAYWELHLSPHDVMAGGLLVTEARGRVSDLAGGDQWVTGRAIVASNGRLHAPLLPLLRP